MLKRASSGSRGCSYRESPPSAQHGSRETGSGHWSPELMTSGGTGRSSKVGRISPNHFSHVHMHTPEETLETALKHGKMPKPREGNSATLPQPASQDRLPSVCWRLSLLWQGHLPISQAEIKTKNTACDRQWEEFQSNEINLPETACYGRINNRPWDRADVGSNLSLPTYLSSNGYLATQSPHSLACKMRVPPPHSSGKLSALSLAHSQPPFCFPLPQVLVEDKVNK